MRAKTEFEVVEKVKDILAEKWHKFGGYSQVKVIGKNLGDFIIFAEKHSTQEAYIIITNSDGNVVGLYREVRNNLY